MPRILSFNLNLPAARLRFLISLLLKDSQNLEYMKLRIMRLLNSENKGYYNALLPIVQTARKVSRNYGLLTQRLSLAQVSLTLLLVFF